MTSLEVPNHPLVEVLADTFASLVDSGSVDIVHEAESDAVELQSDEWTLHIGGWPIEFAWIALDAPTESDAEHRRALNAALGPRDLAALGSANDMLAGALGRGLIQTGDGVSRVLAEMIEG